MKAEQKQEELAKVAALLDEVRSRLAYIRVLDDLDDEHRLSHAYRKAHGSSILVDQERGVGTEAGHAAA